MFQRPAVDMTQTSDHGEYIEILTPGGIVRVNTGLVTTIGGRDTVVVEIEPNMYGRRRTEPGGEWEVEADPHLTGSRLDVRIIKR